MAEDPRWTEKAWHPRNGYGLQEYRRQGKGWGWVHITDRMKGYSFQEVKGWFSALVWAGHERPLRVTKPSGEPTANPRWRHGVLPEPDGDGDAGA